MREIKFRAWWKHPKYNPEGSMYFVGGLMFAEQQPGEPEYDSDGNPTSVGLMERLTNSKIGWNNADECVLMQYTGLHDKNGKEIYEGDIVKVDQSLIGWFPQDIDKPIIEVVEYFQCTFLPLAQVFGVMGSIGVEVIGNIYENPELIKQ